MRRRPRLVRLFALALFVLPLAGGACQKKPAAQTGGPQERRPYTPIPPPPTRTLKPGEPTPPPTLPG